MVLERPFLTGMHISSAKNARGSLSIPRTYERQLHLQPQRGNIVVIAPSYGCSVGRVLGEIHVMPDSEE